MHMCACDQGEPCTVRFVRDMLLTQLIGIDPHVLFNVDHPLRVLNAVLASLQRAPAEPR
jgi:hypothetical protein